MSDIGREIVAAAEAEAAKRFNTEPRLHWRRHNEVVPAAFGDIVASACGHLVPSARATKNAEETDCRECAEVYFAVNPPPWVSGGV